MKTPLQEYIQTRQKRVETALEHYLKQENLPLCQNNKLQQAMHYAVFSGGKRLRPILVYASGEILGANLDDLDAPACAIEFIHTFSLIHDDLPVMDNDDYRRGKPTCHKAFDEATAILAGDALSCLAAEILPTITMVKELMNATGAQGMVMGQGLDMIPAPISEMTDVSWLENMYALKTGMLFRASVKLGALSSSQCSNNELTILDEFAAALGLAFQIKDDLADLTDNQDENKITYPFLVGVEQATAKIDELHKQAISALNKLDNLKHDSSLLKEITDMIVK